MPGMMFIPITKIDATKRMVYASIDETVDRADEIFDYDGNKPHFEKWSSEIAKATDNKSLGNVRAMHSAVAAGKVTGIDFVDQDKRIDFAIKVVDDAEWNKVEEGVYTGISPGGKYLKKWPDTADSSKKRYIAEPVEVSLVDLPCIPSATFTMIKANGATEQRAFKAAPAVDAKPAGGEAQAAAAAAAAATEPPQPTNDQVVARATELAKAAGDETKWPAQIEAARADLVAKAAAAHAAAHAQAPASSAAQVPTNVDPTGEVEQVWKAKDGKTFSKKADAVSHNAALAAAAVASPLDSALGRLGKALDEKEGGTAGDAAAATQPPKSAPALAGSAEKDPKDGEQPPAPAGDPPPAQEPQPLEVAAKATTADAFKAALGKADKDLLGKLNLLGRRVLVRKARSLKAKDALPTGWVPGEPMAKGFYMVGWLGRMLDDFAMLEESLEYKAWQEGMEDGMAEKLGSALGMIGDVLVQLVMAEVAKMKGEEAEEAMAAAAEISDMVKGLHGEIAKGMGAGARVQKIHDHTVKAGAKCAKSNKAAETDDLNKALIENEALRKTISTAVQSVEKLTERVLKLEKQPEPMPALRVVEKQDDAVQAAAQVEAIAKNNPQAVAYELIKISQRFPNTVFARP